MAAWGEQGDYWNPHWNRVEEMKIGPWVARKMKTFLFQARFTVTGSKLLANARMTSRSQHAYH